MKNYNKFQKLSPEEQKFVFELCEKNTYVQAAELIAEPRPDRPLAQHQFIRPPAILRRYHPDAAKTETLGQYANLLQVRHQAAEGAFAEGILALVQNRVLEQLKNGRPLSEMAPDFRILKSAHKSFLEDYAWRKEEGSKAAASNTTNTSEQIAFTHNCDFMRNDIEVDPGAEGVPDKTYCNEVHQRRIGCHRQQSSVSGAKKKTGMPSKRNFTPFPPQPDAQPSEPAASQESHDHSIPEPSPQNHPSHNSHSSHNSHPCPMLPRLPRSRCQPRTSRLIPPQISKNPWKSRLSHQIPLRHAQPRRPRAGSSNRPWPGC